MITYAVLNDGTLVQLPYNAANKNHKRFTFNLININPRVSVTGLPLKPTITVRAKTEQDAAKIYCHYTNLKTCRPYSDDYKGNRVSTVYTKVHTHNVELSKKTQRTIEAEWYV